MRKNVFITLLLLAGACICITKAEIKLPNILTSNMVLQRNKPIVIWGTASPEEPVTVNFKGENKQTKADANGKWAVVFKAQKLADNPEKMIITGPKQVIVLDNILIGDVWFCSGQSNMEYPVRRFSNYKAPAKGEDPTEKIISGDRFQGLRLFHVQKVLDQPDVVTEGWQMCDERSIAPFSAAGYYFGRELYQALNIPIGLIHASWGGTRIETWTPLKAYKESPYFSKDIDEKGRIDNEQIARRYNSMVEPLLPYAVKGFVWYQGESNLMLNETIRYTEKQKLLIDSWRKLWSDSKAPFYFVQLAPYKYSARKDKLPHPTDLLPEFWEAQTLSLDVPYTGMAVITDLVDNLRDIHPSYKWEVGRRLALIALAKDYGKKVTYQGPVFKKMQIKGDNAILSFDHAKGLKTKNGETPTWFQLAGQDNVFYPANAKIEGEKIVLQSDKVSKPMYVRFAWDETAMPNLFNEDGLPVQPFRSNALQWKYKK